ncbi:MAG: ATP-binding protein [bacterium]
MMRQEIKRLIKQPEGQFFEKKSCLERKADGKIRRRKAKDVAKDVAETLSAMANADGGSLILGVEDDDTVTGVNYPSDRIQVIEKAPLNLLRPPLKTALMRKHIQKEMLLVFNVDWSPKVHQLTDGRYLLRVGDSNIPFPAKDIEAIKRSKLQALWENQIVEGAIIEDLNHELIRELASKVGVNTNIEKFLQYYKLIEYYNRTIKLKRAALLLFGKDLLRWHPRCGIDFVKFEGTERRYGQALNIVKRKRIEMPLVLLIEEAYRVVSPHIKERQVLHDLFFVEQLEYPSFAWQEAIVNAVAHRDYSILGLSIEIWMFDDRIEVRSPGLLPEPVTIERLLKRERIHASRNPLIVRVLTDLGYMRETGEGIPRMFEEMEKNGLYPPELRIEADSIFTVVLKNQPVYTPDDLQWLERYSTIPLSSNQKRILLFARTHGIRFTSRDYQKICSVDIYSASRDIKDLMRKGIVRLQKKGGRIYELLEGKGDEFFEFPQGYPEVRAIVERKGYVKNEYLRDALNLSRVQAKWLLQKYLNSSLLKMEGRGRGARYVPTEKFWKTKNG